MCRCAPANCDIRQAKTFLFIVSPRITSQEESVYSKAAVICLYCERFAGKFDVDSAQQKSHRHRHVITRNKDELPRLRLTS